MDIWPFTFKNSTCKRSVGHEKFAWAVSLSLNKRIKTQKHTKILLTYPIQATVAKSYYVTQFVRDETSNYKDFHKHVTNEYV